MSGDFAGDARVGAFGAFEREYGFWSVGYLFLVTRISVLGENTHNYSFPLTITAIPSPSPSTALAIVAAAESTYTFPPTLTIHPSKATPPCCRASPTTSITVPSTRSTHLQS